VCRRLCDGWYSEGQLDLEPPNVVPAGNPMDCDVSKKDDCSGQNHEPLFYPQTLSQCLIVTLWKQNKRMLILLTSCIEMNRIIFVSFGNVKGKCDQLQSCCCFNVFAFTSYVTALGRRFCIPCNEHAHYVTSSRKGRNCNTHSAVYCCFSGPVL
jgi:hypothetical protein